MGIDLEITNQNIEQQMQQMLEEDIDIIIQCIYDLTK